MLLPDLPYEVLRASWSSDGKSIYFTAAMGVHSELFELNLASKTARQLTPTASTRSDRGAWSQPHADT